MMKHEIRQLIKHAHRQRMLGVSRVLNALCEIIDREQSRCAHENTRVHVHREGRTLISYIRCEDCAKRITSPEGGRRVYAA